MGRQGRWAGTLLPARRESSLGTEGTPASSEPVYDCTTIIST